MNLALGSGEDYCDRIGYTDLLQRWMMSSLAQTRCFCTSLLTYKLWFQCVAHDLANWFVNILLAKGGNFGTYVSIYDMMTAFSI